MARENAGWNGTSDVPEESPAGARDKGKGRRRIFRRGRRRLAAVYALAAISFGFGAGMGALYGVSRRRQGRLIGRLESDLALAERTRASLEEALAREKELRTELEAARRRHGEVGTTTLSPPRGETVSVVRRGGGAEREMYARSERERREMSRIAEEKSDELIHRHNRIVELQRQVERLVRERSETKDAADSRERELSRAYETEVRRERRRRKDLEEKLAVLDEIEELHVQLALLADRMQELVREEERRDAEGR